ncbi:MAG: PAS domain S-box protein, partial [Coleofasciculus sp. Co-bin14]|nr:PAS domain S-box protein [Coleofasciculus sp. Co-bin14]
QDDAELLVNELERGGYELISERVDTPTTMKAALDKQQWDVIIADYNLPSFSAPAALKLVQERGWDLPFIIVSGSIGEDVAVAAMKAGAHDYLMKDKLARLIPAIERELREAVERRKRREAEQAVRQNEERFRALIENALDIITVLGADGIIRYTSPSIERVLGYKPEDLFDNNILNYIHSEDITTFISVLNQVTQNPSNTLSLEFRFQHQDGSWRILEAVGKNFLEGSGLSSIVLNARDITERKRAEEIYHALERERALSEERFNFVSMMSHEFCNPLSSIIVSSDILKNFRHKATQEQANRCLDRIEAAAYEMTQLLEDILSLTKAEVGKLEIKPQPFDLKKLCQQLVEGMRLTTGNQHTLTFVSQGECNQAYMDESLLKHILTNLLANAIKYSPEGSTVRLELFCQNEEAIFKIQDQGIGIPPGDQQHLFEPFHRGRNVGKIPGTGLGLCIVKKFVDLHKGTIALKSEVGVGTTFIVTLPLNHQTSVEKRHNASTSCTW